MEVRYDFTHDRLFTKKQIKREINKLLKNSMNIKYPWDIDKIKSIVTENDLCSKNGEYLMFLGTNDEIKLKKELYQVEQGVKCDCCGCKIIQYPWNFIKYTLCDKCLRDLNNSCRTTEEQLYHIKKPRINLDTLYWLGFIK